MQKEYEVTVTVEVTVVSNVTAASPEAAENEAEALFQEALEGLSPGGEVRILGAPQLISSEAYEVSESEFLEEGD